MPSYRDTLHLLPLDCFVPSLTHADLMEQVDQEIQAVGFIHGHKSEDSVEFQVDADDLWELRERMDDLKLSVLPYAELDIRRECVLESQRYSEPNPHRDDKEFPLNPYREKMGLPTRPTADEV